MNRTVILGGGYGGALAAARLARQGHPVLLIDAADGLVERVRLHQMAAGDDIPSVSYRTLFGKCDVEHLQTRVTSVDRAAGLVRTTAGDIPYHRLLLALGSTEDTSLVPGAADHALTLGSPARAMLLRRRLLSARRIAVVGGGLTGIEIAAEIAERIPDRSIVLIDRGAIGGHLTPRARRYLKDWFAERNVALREGEGVIRVHEGGLDLADGASLESDLVIWCGSFVPSPVGSAAGLRSDESGRVLVDRHLRSSDPRIYAIGDAARCADMRMGCATALPMAAHAADVMAGRTDAPFRYAHSLLCISLGRNDGIIQRLHEDDTPRASFLKGRPAAWIKELVCRFAVASIRMERAGVQYVWPKPKAA